MVDGNLLDEFLRQSSLLFSSTVVGCWRGVGGRPGWNSAVEPPCGVDVTPLTIYPADGEETSLSLVIDGFFHAECALAGEGGIMHN